MLLLLLFVLGSVVGVGFRKEEEFIGLFDAFVNGFGAAYFVRSFDTLC